ncbi:hypothetical protein [Stieleria varia]|uniref:Uncharacterized protein n=1 Tax=Stieleria varia TaxID=2528005 RepID=A0A5C6APH6_9BACT|nr:hypothetical protein [Stieleria varia]TWU01331.1 hypothetical protein Pla52n_47050 [Stieleria varia]
MSSDHWNFLANLLGTPGPAKPPKKKNDDPAPQAAEEKPTTDPDSDAETASKPAFPAAQPSSGDTPSSVDVLDALTAAVPAETLPGFGVRDSDPALEDLTAAGPPAEKQPVVSELLDRKKERTAADSLFAQRDELAELTASTSQIDEASDAEPSSPVDVSAWNELAGELGVDAVDEPRPYREPQTFESKVSETKKPAPPRSGSGFGSGLGLDLGADEPESESEFDEVSSKPIVQSTPGTDLGFVGFDDLDDDEASEVSDRFAVDDEPKSPAPAPQSEPKIVDPLAFSSFADLDDDDDHSPAGDDIGIIEVVPREAWTGVSAPRGAAKRQRDKRNEPDQEHSFRTERDTVEGDDRGPRRRRRRGVRQQIDLDEVVESVGEDDQTQTQPKSRREPAGREPAGRERESRGGRDRVSSDRPAAERSESGRSESGRSESGRSELGRSDLGRSDSERGESVRGESVRGDGDRPRSRRRRSRGSSERSDIASAPKSEPQRGSRGRAERPDDDLPLDEFDGFGLDIDPFDDDDDDDLLETSAEKSDSDDDDESGEPRKRRRKRGRRGRGGRGRKSETSSATDAEVDDMPLVDEIGWSDVDDDDEPVSAFDDDHEDAEEVEVMRRGRRRRGGRGRGRDNKREDGDSTTSDRDPDAPRGRQTRSTEPAADSDTDRDDSARRKPVPTWLELIDLLVESNIQNHKKSPQQKSRSSGRSGGGGGRRRSNSKD